MENFKGEIIIRPKEIDKHFNCSGCHKLESLQGAPKIVYGIFNCSGCPKLHSLDGIGEVRGNIVSDID